MQVSCFGFDWNEVGKRSDAQQIVNEMIHTDDIDIYAKYLPDTLWHSDSAHQYFSVAEAISTLQEHAPPEMKAGLEAAATLISQGNAVDELGIGELTDGCYFISMSPERVAELHSAFSALDLSSLGALFAKIRTESLAKSLPDVEADFVAYLKQWAEALKFINENRCGIIVHCG